MTNSSFTKSEKLLVAIVALTAFILHIFINVNGAYGFFRDDLYYIVCSDHLDWGYVDQPPFSLFLLKAGRLLLGDSLVAIRTIPALCISMVICLAAVIVKQMGGNFLAILLATVSILVSPIHIGMGSFYS